jgi:hypothetical protein
MARALPGPVISSIAGSIGGISFRNDRSGLVISNKQQPTRKFSAGQLEHRGILSASARGWAALDADIKRAWTSLAATEQIPTAYSRGRRWTGRQLYTCFFIQAEHQYTPLPARWLPTPPLFWPDIQLFMAYFVGYDAGAPNDWQCWCSISTSLPVSLEPPPAIQYEESGAVTVWAGLLPFGARRAPRSVSRVAPAPLSIAVDNASSGAAVPDPCPHYYSGFEYTSFFTPEAFTLGIPRGISAVAPTGPGQTPCTSFAARASCVTDERLYYSPWLYGDSYVSNGFTPAYASNDYQILPEEYLKPSVSRDWDVLSVPTSEY